MLAGRIELIGPSLTLGGPMVRCFEGEIAVGFMGRNHDR